MDTVNAFLVLAGNHVEHVPLRLCATEAEAVEYAAKVTYADVIEAAETIGIDASPDPIDWVACVPFRDGPPQQRLTLRNFEEGELDEEREQLKRGIANTGP